MRLGLRIDVHRPSTWWLAVGAICAALAAGALIAAIAHQRSTSQPIGEGEVFASDTAAAVSIVADADSEEDGIRHARNALDVEAVSLLDQEGVVVASTSKTFVGETVSNPLLGFGASAGRFVALAAPTGQPLEVDGVPEWPSGSILYQVVSPLDQPGQALLLHYDVSKLLARRARPGQIDPITIQLVALGLVFGLLAAAVAVGHTRASRRHREMALEAELLRTHSEELEQTNAELADARRSAERSLILAEEKMRIRSDFVLMINHELRTPLTAVVTGAEVVRQGNLTDSEEHQVLNEMVSEGRRLNEIIDQILAVARIENRGLSYELVEVSLDEACAATNASREVTAGNGVADGHVWVRTDVGTLALVIASLSDNALTHGASQVWTNCSVEPAIEPMIEVGQRPRRSVFFCVEDDGPGIDPHFLPRAFEKFEKHSSSSGTGLGLYMARLMVEALDGSISVNTSPSGTTFQIAVPAVVRSRVRERV